MGVLSDLRTFDRRDYMGTDISVKNISPRDVKSVQKKLAELYSRRSDVESLIRCLESYARCQAKSGSRERLNLRSA
jgi:hypothetical protein